MIVANSDDAYARVPAELKTLPRWILLKSEYRDQVRDGQRIAVLTKVPYTVNDYRASTTDPSTWATYEDARGAVASIGADGLGFVFTDDDNIAGIDLDHVVNAETGEVHSWALSLIDRLDSYTEYSPSGTGYHVLVRGKKPPGPSNLRFNSVTREGFEIYERDRYFTVSGNHVPGTPAEIRKIADYVISGVLDDMGLLGRMSKASNGDRLLRLYHGESEADYGSQSEADMALCGALAFWTGKNPERMDRLFRSSGLMREKWDSPRGESSYGAQTIAKACAGCSDTYPGNVTPINTKRTTSGAIRANRSDWKTKGASVMDEDASGEDDNRVDAGTGGATAGIDVTQCDLPPLTSRALGALVDANTPPKLFRQKGLVVRIDADELNQHRITAVTFPRMRHALARAINFYKARKNGQVAVEPPRVLVENILASPDLPFPGLRGLATAPFFTGTGRLVNTPGFDAESQLYLSFDEGLEIPDVPESPSAEQLGNAVATILDLFADFPFQGEADRAHAFAMLLLPFVRDMIEGPTPLHLVDAPTVGTGKTLLSQTALMPACGNVAVTTFGRDEQEQRKRITTILLHGQPAVLLDNLSGKLDSAPLAAVLTTQTWADRALGGHEQPKLANRATWVATSNNAKLSEEITRRTVLIRIDAQVERPFDREEMWRHPNLLEYARKHRGELIAAALTVVQSWISAGRPELSLKPMGSYEAWSAIVGGILEYAGVEGFLGNVKQLFETVDDAGEALRAFVAEWSEAHGENPVTPKVLLPTAAGAGIELGAGDDSTKATQLGRLLSANADRVFNIKLAGVYRIERRARNNTGNRWGLCLISRPGDINRVGGVGCVGLSGASSSSNSEVPF